MTDAADAHRHSRHRMARYGTRPWTLLTSIIRRYPTDNCHSLKQAEVPNSGKHLAEKLA